MKKKLINKKLKETVIYKLNVVEQKLNKTFKIK